MAFIAGPRKSTVPVPLLLDTYPGAVGAWSLRHLNSDYNGACIRVREDSGNTETDIGFDANGDLDTSALLAHCGANNGFVTKWYGQESAGGTGSGNDMTQVTAAQQPRIVNAGTIEVSAYNGKPGINQSTGTMRLTLDSSIATTALCYAHHVFDRSASGKINAGLQFNTSGGATSFLWFSNNTIYTRVGGAALTVHDTSQTQTGDFLATILRDSSDNVKYWLNGSAGTTKNYAHSAQTYTTWGVYYQDNQISQELIYYNTDQESNRSGIESNTNTYYSIW